MIRFALLASVAALSLTAAACKETTSTVTQNQPQAEEMNVPDDPGVANLSGSAAPAGAPTTAPEFAALAAGSDLFEIASGKLAQAKGGSDVKSFGAQLVEEHTKSSNEMKAALAHVRPAIPLPSAPPAELQARLQALQGLSGDAFDRQFIADQIASHQQSLAAINGYIAAGDNPALRDWARKATGTIQKHLQQLNRMTQG
jgi:putative membrane protein